MIMMFRCCYLSSNLLCCIWGTRPQWRSRKLQLMAFDACTQLLDSFDDDVNAIVEDIKAIAFY